MTIQELAKLVRSAWELTSLKRRPSVARLEADLERRYGTLTPEQMDVVVDYYEDMICRVKKFKEIKSYGDISIAFSRGAALWSYTDHLRHGLDHYEIKSLLETGKIKYLLLGSFTAYSI